MAGIYIHIPFCRKACTYCNFHFSTHTKTLPDLVAGIAWELQHKKDFFEGQSLQTIYFGGGTPSLLESKQLEQILDAVRNHFPILEQAEFTLEANPDDMTEPKLKDWKSVGINRLSVGVQSFRDQDLSWMNRSHRSQQAISALELAQKIGFDNLSLDLIYALPGLSDEAWKANIQQAFALGITHLSSYSLTVEEKTKLRHLIKKGEMPGEDDEQSARQFELLMQEADLAGFEQYEISNFAKPGFRSQHNSSYWKRQPYLGIGPSAHSFKHQTRTWNVSSNAAYLQGVAKGILETESEQLSTENIANEIVMTGLRTKEGFQLQHIQDLNLPNFNAWLDLLKSHLQQGMVQQSQGFVQLSHRGKFYADEIASDLFF